MSDIKSVLFICTGNSCRSIMAEGLLKKYLKKQGKSHIEVRSAGISAMGGLFPTDETVEVMRDEGVDVCNYISRKLTEEMIRTSDLVLVMEDLHKKTVVEMVPEAGQKTYLLKEYGLGEEKAGGAKTIPDPVGKPIKDYKTCMNIIKSEIERVAKLL